VSRFVDAAQLHVKAGDGGAGCVSFRREAHVAKGGPDGGDGGHGGDVWLVADQNQASLLGFRDHPHHRATDGRHGTSKRQHGAGGKDLTVAVPVGTVVNDTSGAVLVDLSAAGQRWRAAEGGLGGMGNARFLSNRRRAPAFAEQGERGDERWLDLELKLRADVALIGLPNVGKSTLISRISAARPKIADYPFTTLVPNLGVVRVGERASSVSAATEFVVADIPGLIEGAAEGKGLGHDFLKHIEHAGVLCVLLDVAPTAPIAPDAQLAVLLGELGRYLPELLERPRVLVAARADLIGPDVAIDPAWIAVSSVTGTGLAELLNVLAEHVQALRGAPAPTSEVVVHRPLTETVTVERAGNGHWRVLGRAAQRAARFQDLNDEGALEEIVRRLRALGVDRLLARAGVADGDIVEVGSLSLEWWRDAADAPSDNARRRTRAERTADRQGEPGITDDE
jgi:GTPase